MQNEYRRREKVNSDASEHQRTMEEWLECLWDARQTLLFMWLVASFRFLSLHLMRFWRFIEIERVYEVSPGHFPSSSVKKRALVLSSVCLFLSFPCQHFHWKVSDLSENSNLHQFLLSKLSPLKCRASLSHLWASSFAAARKTGAILN